MSVGSALRGKTAPVRDRLRFLNESAEVRREVVDRVIAARLADGRGKIIELDKPAPLVPGVRS